VFPGDYHSYLKIELASDRFLVFLQNWDAPSLPSPNRYLDLLSKREVEVLRLVGQGKNNQEIAQELYFSRPKTFAIALPWNNNCSF
jgi:DNA-binding NarL/FixJ family response regulator